MTAVAPTCAPPVALYVHVPFCVSLCPYCDFVVYPGAAARGPRNRIGAFVDALHAEIDLRADALDRRFGRPGTGRPALGSVYLGGGTPSLLPSDTIAAVLDRVADRFGLAPDAEVTLEVNPGPDERGDPAAQHRVGVTRLSIGAQSMVDHELRGLGRRHKVTDVGECVAASRAGGIASISLDLLYDVPGQTLPSWQASLEAALALAPDHLSLYALTLDDPDAEGITGPDGDHLPVRAGARRWRGAARARQDDDRAATQYGWASETLAARAWHGYEISNWSKPGHESRHNQVYWERRPYEAVGPGAHAFDGDIRRWNGARLDAYISSLAPSDGSTSRLPPGGFETIDAATAERETLILALRTDRGTPATAFLAPERGAVLAWARSNDLVARDPDQRVRLTTRGRLLSNEVFARLV